MAPRDEAMLVHMLRTAIAHEGPAALRYPRGAAEGVELPRRAEEIPIGTGELLESGERVALLGYGYGVTVGQDAAGDPRRPRPEADRRRRPVREADRHRAARAAGAGPRSDRDDRGGRPSRRLRVGGARTPRGRVQRRPEERARLLRIGLPDRFVTHGKPALLRKEVGLTGASVAERVLAELRSGEPALH